ncbi:MAG: PIN domain protein [Verrucomicrobia bacterium ADurb.Bin006]|jgi:predicted nucleic acid-binding protein|nr:MAG: PIN domain protein [Verrucomicrobia bacterium ADurb.Bin006]
MVRCNCASCRRLRLDTTPESPLPPEPVVKIEREEDALLICSVSLAELARRLRDLGASPGEAWTLISDYVQAVDEVVPVDQEVAHESYRLSVSATTRLPLADALIAAAACIRQAVLVHRDSHMRGVAGVVQQLHLDAG